MQKYLKIGIVTIVLIIFWRISQIIFDVMYSTTKKSYLWLSHGQRVTSLAPDGWYFEYHFNYFTTSKPSPLKDTSISRFQDQCTYGQGNCYGFFGQDILSSFRWINAIQYIAQQVDTNEPSDITNRFESLFAIQPKRYYPYIILQYLGVPSLQTQDQIHATISWDNTVLLWEKGIRYYCNRDMLQKIKELSYQSFIEKLETKDPNYRYPCSQGGELAHTLAFNYYYYLSDNEKASFYYKVAAFHDNVAAITKSMPALIEGKIGNNKISAYLWYDQWSSAMEKYNNNKNLNPDEIASLESTMEKAFQKMVSEYSLYLITQASHSAGEQGESQECQQTLACLQKNWYIKQQLTAVEQNCANSTDIDCQIVRYGKEKKWIQSNGVLISPDQKSSYIRKDDKFTQWLQ